jgi:hypothetical protein
LDWALSVATGSTWLGYPATRSRVLYTAGDEDEDRPLRHAPQRILAWCKAHWLSQGELRQIRLLPGRQDLLDPKAIDHLARTIREEPPALLVIDGLLQCFGDGDAESAEDMQAFIQNCRRLQETFPGITILVIDWVGEEAEDAGSLLLEGTADIGFTLTQTGRPRDQEHLLKETRPHRDSPPLPDRRLRLQEIDVGSGRTSVVLREAPARQPRRIILPPDQGTL